MATSQWHFLGTNEDQRVAFIEDLDLPGTMSVTNDAENVVAQVNALYPGYRIIYRDSIGGWDELLHRNGVFIAFKLLPRCFTPEITHPNRRK